MSKIKTRADIEILAEQLYCAIPELPDNVEIVISNNLKDHIELSRSIMGKDSFVPNEGVFTTQCGLLIRIKCKSTNKKDIFEDAVRELDEAISIIKGKLK